MPIQPIEPASVNRRTKPTGTREVFNPDGGELEFRHASSDTPYKLASKTLTNLPAEVAEHAERVLGVWGVRIVESQEDIKAAVEDHAKAVDQWAKDVLVEAAEEAQKLQAAGVRVKDSDEVKRAKDWLKNRS